MKNLFKNVKLKNTPFKKHAKNKPEAEEKRRALIDRILHRIMEIICFSANVRHRF